MKKISLIMFLLLVLSSLCKAEDKIINLENYVFNKGEKIEFHAYQIYSDPSIQPVFYTWEVISGPVGIEYEGPIISYIRGGRAGDFEFRYYAVYPNGDTVTMYVSGKFINNDGNGGGTIGNPGAV